MKEEAPQFVKVIAFVLVVIFVFLCILLFRQFQHAKRMHEIDSYKILIDNVRHKDPLTVSDVPIIQSWMTFAYIDTIFNIPPAYLQNTLVITDSHYPRISLGRYAKSQHVSEASVVGTVKKVVTDYLTSTTALSTSTSSSFPNY